MTKAKAEQMLASAGYEMGHGATVLALTPAVLEAALRAWRAAHAQFMLSEEAAARMVAEAVLEAASR